MSYVTTIDIFCDGKGCAAWGDDFCQTETSKRAMDKIAKRWGWRKTATGHLCPVCVAKIKQIEDQPTKENL
jgi:hypothetical protein